MPPIVMGIVNVTPDSFSDGGLYLDPSAAVRHGRELVHDGAGVVDVGGESSRPGADPVPSADEIARVIPVIEALASETRISVDTTKPEVARAAVGAGATIVNDVSGSLHGVAAELGVGWIAMHRQGDPKSMQEAPHYDDVVAEVCDWLASAAATGLAAGVPEVWVDPGIGFGKTRAHNVALLANLDRIVALGHPVVVGVSRKATVGAIHADSDRVDHVAADDRLEGSVALATWAMMQGVAMVRVHDARSTVHAVKVVTA